MLSESFMSNQENDPFKLPDSHSGKKEVIDLYEKFEFFMILFAIIYAIVIIAKILRIKKNNGSKLIYLLSVILMSLR